MTGQLALPVDDREQLGRAWGTCPTCGASGTTPCGWWTGLACFEDKGAGPRVHRDGQPNVHGCRPTTPQEDPCAT